VGARRAPASDPLASGGIKGGIMGEDTSYDLGPSDAAGPDSDRYATVAFDEEAAEAEEEARRAARAAARLAAAQAQAAAAAAAKRAAAGGDLLADLDEVEVEGDSSSSAAATAAAGAKRPRADVAAGIDLERDADVQAIRAGRYDMLGEGEAARADNSVGAGAGVDAAFMNRRERRAAGIKGGGGGKGSFASAISSSGSSWLKKLQSGGDDDEDEHKKRQAKRNKSDLQLRAIERIIEDRKAGRAPAFNPAAKAKPAKDQSQNWS
jgi:SWI/SNF-related matrix-associated actin-dependent regulator 1 of chromatin subfamily A